MKKGFILFYLCLFQFVFAETVNLDLQSAIQLAYDNNKDIKRQKIVLDAAARSTKNSYNSLIPSMSITAGDAFSFPGEEPANAINIEGNISLNFKSSVKASADKNKINFQIEQTNYEILKNSVRQSVCDSYYEILDIQQQIFLKSENIQILKELYEENQIMYKKGFLSEIEYLNSKILYEKSKSELMALQLELNNLVNNFKLVLGLPVTQKITFCAELVSFFDSYSSQFTSQLQSELLSQANTNELPEIKLLVLQKLQSEKELQITKMNNWGPDFNLSYQINPVFGTAETGGKLKNTFSAGVTIPFENLLPSSQGREEINLAQDQINYIDIQIAAKKQEAEITLANLMLLVNQKMETLKTCKTLVDITNNNLNICKTSYSNGMIDFQSLKTANTEYLDSQLEYSNMILDILKTFSSIEQIIGKEFNEFLEITE